VFVRHNATNENLKEGDAQYHLVCQGINSLRWWIWKDSFTNEDLCTWPERGKKRLENGDRVRITPIVENVSEYVAVRNDWLFLKEIVLLESNSRPHVRVW
jgi:hypothetical protein